MNDFLISAAISAMPAALREFPGAVDEVRKYREAVTVHLRHAASKKRCMFDLDWKAGAGMLMPHLAKARDLARRAVMYGKLQELEGDSGGAARVYLDVIRMGLHLEQDPTLISVLVGIAVVGIAGPQIEGLLAREPNARTARLIFEELRDLPRERFDASRAVDFECVLFGGWMRRETADLAEKGSKGVKEALEATDGVLGMLGGGLGEHKPWRIPERPEDIRREFDEAFEAYDRQMGRLVRLMEKPYHETRQEIARFEKTQTSYWKGQIAKGRFAAALIDRTAQAWSSLQGHLMRAEARLRGLEILAAACLARRERGNYPADVAGLARYFPKGIPPDPVSGKPFAYWLGDGLPAVEGEADAPDLREKRPQLYHFGLAYRLSLERDALDEWRAEQKARAKREARPPEGEADPDNVW
jgi:hypothetical protein